MSDSKQLIPNNRRLFGVYIYYRLSMGVLLYVLFISGLAEGILGTSEPNLFMYSSLIYICFCCLSFTLYTLDMISAKNNHLLFLLIVDFVGLVLMIYASNSASVGLGYLLLIPMAISGTFLKGQANIGLAAFASILVLATGVFNSIHGASDSSSSIFTAGITGVLLFVTAIAFNIFSQRLKASETQIQEQIKHSNYLQRVGQRIVETIHAGIVVIDDELNIQLINKAAKDLLSHQAPFHSLQQIAELFKLLKRWQMTLELPATTTLRLGVNHDIKISFTNLADTNQTSIMLFIEDEREINQEAQQLKLASLGRLTASIAHEIRNPLGAISHAGQLLDESSHIHASDQELLKMIQINSKRIDQIISNILQFSRRKGAIPEGINVCLWLEKFRTDYLAHNDSKIVLDLQKKNVYCRMDPNHLQQIVSNLVDNGFKHGHSINGTKMITLSANIEPSSKLPYIDIIDEGDGIKEEDIDKIFEPFYTTKKTGSGLGLYLCKELCLANQADIVYFNKTETQKSCFRLILCHAQKSS